VLPNKEASIGRFLIEFFKRPLHRYHDAIQSMPTRGFKAFGAKRLKTCHNFTQKQFVRATDRKTINIQTTGPPTAKIQQFSVAL